MVKQVENQAAEIGQNATAQSSLILSKAQVMVQNIVQGDKERRREEVKVVRKVRGLDRDRSEYRL